MIVDVVIIIVLITFGMFAKAVAGIGEKENEKSNGSRK